MNRFPIVPAVLKLFQIERAGTQYSDCSSHLTAQAVLAFLVTLATLLSGASEGLCEVSGDVTQTSVDPKVTHVQPMTGIVLWTDNEHVTTDAISLEYRYCGYDEIVNADGTYDYTKLERILDEVAARNHQAILRFRFVYPGKPTTVPEFIRKAPGYDETIGKSEGEKTSFCDWSHPALQQFTLQFYTNFAKRYDRDPRIAFLQTGFGLWAEYHIYDGPRKLGKTFPDKDYQSKFLKHLSSTFQSLPWSISVDAADDDYSPLEDNPKLLSLGFGVFDDSFLCKQHPRENAVNWRILGNDRWKTSPAGGEFSYYNRRDQKLALADRGPNGVSFKDAAAEFHISYMIGSDQPTFQPMTRIEEASMATGYRFRITKIAKTDAATEITATNEGVAPIYRDAFFSIRGQRSTQTLRGLLPGETKTYRVNADGLTDRTEITIQSDFILPTQTISFEG